MEKVTLKSSDDELFEVPVEVAKCFGIIKTMLEDLGMNNNDNAVIPLPNVKGDILKKVICWVNYHKDDPQPAKDEEVEDEKKDQKYLFCSWDTDFLRVKMHTLFDLIKAANYLDIKGLSEVTHKAVANMIIGKTVEEIRQTFNIVNDFTPAEEKRVRKQNQWLEEFF